MYSTYEGCAEKRHHMPKSCHRAQSRQIRHNVRVRLPACEALQFLSSLHDAYCQICMVADNVDAVRVLVVTYTVKPGLLSPHTVAPSLQFVWSSFPSPLPLHLTPPAEHTHAHAHNTTDMLMQTTQRSVSPSAYPHPSSLSLPFSLSLSIVSLLQTTAPCMQISSSSHTLFYGSAPTRPLSARLPTDYSHACCLDQGQMHRLAYRPLCPWMDLDRAA